MTTIAQQLASAIGWPALPMQLILSLAICVLAWLALRIGETMIDRISRHHLEQSASGRLRTVHSLLYHVFRVVVFFFAITAILGLFGINTASLIAAAGIGGIAVALGAQHVVSDLISGVLLLLDNTVNIGDYVELGSGVKGEVVGMKLRQIIVKGYTGMNYIVPNTEVKILANYGKGPFQTDVVLAVPAHISLEQIQAMTQRLQDRVKAEHAGEFLTPPYFIGIDRVGALSYDVTIGARADMAHFWSAPRTLRALALEEMHQMDAYAEGPSDMQKAQKTQTLVDNRETRERI